MAVTYRDVDNILRTYPGATSVAVSYASFASLSASPDAKASVPTHKRHIEYMPSSPIATSIKIIPSATLGVNDLYVHT